MFNLKSIPMKKSFLFLSFLLVATLFIKAQTPLTTAADFTANDAYGESHTLFDYLDDDKYVAIMFTASWCSNCPAIYPIMQDSYEYFGCNTGNVITMVISQDHSATAMQGITGDFIKIPDPPGNAINNNYSIGAYPTIILIAPNRNIVNQDIWPINNDILRNAITNAGGIPSSCDPLEPDNIDAQLLSIVSPVAFYSEAQQIVPVVTIRNNGVDNITEADVSYVLNSDDPVVVNWTGSLETGETADVSFDAIDIVTGNHVFVATVTVAGDENPDNNSMTRNFTVADCSESINIPFNEDFDSADLPSCWIVQNQHPTHTWASTTGYNIGGTTPVDPQIGSHFWYVNWSDTQAQDEWLISPSFDLSDVPNPEMKFWFNGNYHWSVDPNDNCDLILLVSVDGGDWVEVWNETDHPDFTSTAASYVWLETIIDLGNYVGVADFRFAFRYTGFDGAQFAIDNITIEEQGTTSACINKLSIGIDVYPNPADSHIIISLQEISSGNSLSIYNQLGQKVINAEINTQLFEVSVKDLSKGMYFINIIDSNGVIINTQRFIKN